MDKQQLLKLIDEVSNDVFDNKMRLEEEAVEEFDRAERLGYVPEALFQNLDHSRTDKASRDFIACGSRWHKIRDLYRTIEHYDDNVTLKTIINDVD